MQFNLHLSCAHPWLVMFDKSNGFEAKEAPPNYYDPTGTAFMSKDSAIKVADELNSSVFGRRQ